MRKTTRVMISTFGALVGLIGIEHGTGEVLQGNLTPSGIMILSWPESAFFHVLGGEPALTILPNLFMTGILAILFSLAYLVWAVLFVQRKNGGLILMLLSVAMLLFGGGVFPPVFGILLGAAATRINAPLTWWRLHLSPGLRRFLGELWPWFFGACVISWLGMFPGITVLSYFFGVEDATLIFTLLFCMFAFLLLASIAAFSRDLQRAEGVG
ncbi:MAG: hypothetical protein P8Z00_01705 [Anaerolineales bacterium]|jgi:hypothetical protein